MNTSVIHKAHGGQAAEPEDHKPNQATVKQNNALVKEPNLSPEETKSCLKWKSTEINLGLVEEQQAAWL